MTLLFLLDFMSPSSHPPPFRYITVTPHAFLLRNTLSWEQFHVDSIERPLNVDWDEGIISCFSPHLVLRAPDPVFLMQMCFRTSHAAGEDGLWVVRHCV